MALRGHILNVFIASPGDVPLARDRVEQVIHSWNSDHARTRGVILLPRRWELSAVSQLGVGDAQEVINSQLVDEADIVIALLHSRLGTATSRAESGTVEEIRRSLDRGIRVHLYFSNMVGDISRIDVDQLSALREFRSEIENSGLGLTEEFASVDDLAWRVRSALEFDVAEFVGSLGSGESSEAQPATDETRASFRVQYLFDEAPEVTSRGRVRNKKSRHRIELSNVGQRIADELSVAVSAQSEGDPPLIRDEYANGIRINPGNSVAVPVFPTMGTAVQWRVDLRWLEDGEELSETHTVSGV